MRPSSIWTIVTRAREYTGTERRFETMAKSFAPGMASSRAKAQVQRDAATVMEMEQKAVTPRTRKTKPKPPPGEPCFC